MSTKSAIINSLGHVFFNLDVPKFVYKHVTLFSSSRFEDFLSLFNYLSFALSQYIADLDEQLDDNAKGQLQAPQEGETLEVIIDGYTLDTAPHLVLVSKSGCSITNISVLGMLP
ncbi:unnamed protein product [Hymenolepis diminuta]|uniref:Uncharacterized protein n=1 Tax=Hymenolepis diminuta TaxID=6216 RepID=A0A564YQQ8_HYMDI|nr:unnamed protein product [Hymenolepis diminuta]